MRARSILAVAAVIVLGALFAGCGAKYDLPTERRLGRVVPGDNSYQMIATWHGMSGIQDALLTPGIGTQLFLLFNNGIGAAGNGVFDYFLSRPQRLGHSMTGMLNPYAVTFGGDGGGGAANRIFVLDQGDTLNAKQEYVPRDTCTVNCDTTVHPIPRRYIADLGKYWRVREYGLLGGDTVSTFTDTTLVFVSGVAADAEGSVYVAGVASVLTAASQQGLFNRSLVYKVYKYRRGPKYAGVFPFDGTMPGAMWHRDTTYFHTEGTGVGFVRDPRGIAWGAYAPTALYIADYGNSSGQKVSDTDTTGYFRYEQDDAGVLLAGPLDITADVGGYVYIADTGNHRVLRYSPGGSFVQRVDIEPDDQGATLLTPVAVAASDSIVYVADRGRSEVVRYQRRK